mmetsp:Transcript_36922/g.33186  ORF Transcript_36922/g.33186 Transcript_36922/m.33186 type:complete len:248 (-) Transcript_36922:1026-1769(-)
MPDILSVCNFGTSSLVGIIRESCSFTSLGLNFDSKANLDKLSALSWCDGDSPFKLIYFSGNGDLFGALGKIGGHIFFLFFNHINFVIFLRLGILDSTTCSSTIFSELIQTFSHSDFGITIEHSIVGSEEERIFDGSITLTFGSFDDNSLLCFPHFTNWHSSNRRIGIFKGIRIHDIIGTYNNNQICGGEVFVDFIHFLDHCVRNIRFSKQDIHMTRQSTSNRMDTEVCFFPSCLELLAKISNNFLAF